MDYPGNLFAVAAPSGTGKSSLVKAQQDYERLKPLVEQDAAAKHDLDAAVAALRSAEASVRANKANVEQTRLTTETQVKSTEGKVQAQRGAPGQRRAGTRVEAGGHPALPLGEIAVERRGTRALRQQRTVREVGRVHPPM